MFFLTVRGYRRGAVGGDTDRRVDGGVGGGTRLSLPANTVGACSAPCLRERSSVSRHARTDRSHPDQDPVSTQEAFRRLIERACRKRR